MPALSIVLATTHRWPEVEPTLDAIFAAEPVDMEVILCDGHGNGAPPPDRFGDAPLRVIARPGASVFALRARGVAQAFGDVVAITEDHCLPARDWPRQVIAAHERHPEAVAVAGAVTNGSTDDPWDCANFLMTFAEHLPPMPPKPTVRAPSVANGSVKRAAAGIPAEPEPGWFETELMLGLIRAGLVARDDGPRVVHVQSHGSPRATLAAHFHNGRATAGLRAQPPGLRALAAERARISRLPFQLAAETRVALADRPPLSGQEARGARLVPVVALAHTVGELTGLLAGPGRSAELLD